MQHNKKKTQRCSVFKRGFLRERLTFLFMMGEFTDTRDEQLFRPMM